MTGVFCTPVEPFRPNKVVSSTDDSALPDSVKARYREDATIMALRDVLADSTTKYSLIRLPSATIISYYKGLVAIHNASKLTASDSVARIEELHIWDNAVLHRLVVQLPNDSGWWNPWREQMRFTGNAGIDSLLATYSLDLDFYLDFQTSDFAAFITDSSWNMTALCTRFAEIDGVVGAETESVMGDGDDITCAVGQGYLIYTFDYGFGWCLQASCLYHHYWDFRVYHDSTVEFAGSYGDPLPPEYGSGRK